MAYYGNEHGLMIFRKHAVEYMKGKWPSIDSRKDILTMADWQVFLKKIQHILLA